MYSIIAIAQGHMCMHIFSYTTAPYLILIKFNKLPTTPCTISLNTKIEAYYCSNTYVYIRVSERPLYKILNINFS